MLTRQVMAIILAAFLWASGVKAEVPASADTLITVSIHGETLAEIFDQLGRQYGYTVGLAPGVFGNRSGPDMTVSPLPATRAFAIVAAAYGACAVVDSNIVHVLSCDAAERLRNALATAPSDVALPRVALGVVVRDAGVLIEGDIRGAEVVGIDDQGRGYKAGIREGDSILGYMGEPISGAAHLKSLVGSAQPGDGIIVEVLRGTERLTFDVQF